MHALLETSQSVVTLTPPKNNIGNTEGNYCALDEYKRLPDWLFDIPTSIEYSKSEYYNWANIKSIWDENWNNKNPNAIIRLQKTPSDIFRVKLMQESFTPTKWIISVKNPYYYLTSLINYSRNSNIVNDLETVCLYINNVYKIQLENKELLGTDAYTMTCEDFALNPNKHKLGIETFMPELGSIDLNRPLNIKGNMSFSVTDNSKSKLDLLLEKYPTIINDSNVYFKQSESLINNWGYSLI
jgi:hypothetical protein